MGMLSELEQSRQPPKTMQPSPEDTQRTCIDLPGERAQCYLYKSKLQVVLRKHRDVIFDIHMGNGASYTVEADESDFYDAVEKKLNEVKRKHKVTFKDGERAHLWLSRNFTGHLILRSEGKLLARYSPRSMDSRFYDDDPKTKPAPIMIVMKKEEQAPAKGAPQASAIPAAPAPAANAPKASVLSADRFPVGVGKYPTQSPKGSGHSTDRGYFEIGYQDLMPTQRETQSMHVLEVVEMKSAPKEVLQFFMDGGEELDLDPNRIVTQNWILSQMFGAEAWAFDNRRWAKELMGTKFRLQRVVHKSGPKLYMIFIGCSGLREVMNASRYAITNTKVLKITAGAGAGGQAWGVARGAMNDSVKAFAKEEGRLVFKGGGVAVLLTIGMDTAEWYKDYSEIGPNGKPKRDFIDLLAKIGVDLFKAGISAAVASLAVSTILSIAISAGIIVSAPVTAIVIGTLVVAVGVGYLLDIVDKEIGSAANSKDITNIISNGVKNAGGFLKANEKREEKYSSYPLHFEAGH